MTAPPVDPEATTAVLRVLGDCSGWVTWPMLFAAVGHEVPQTRARDALLRLHGLGVVARRDRGSSDAARDPAYRLGPAPGV